MFFDAFPYRLRGFTLLTLLLVVTMSVAACGATTSPSTSGGSAAEVPSSEAPFPRTLIEIGRAHV